MRIRRYEAKDSRTALARIKEEMGDDAVILATKNIAGRHGHSSMVEIVAAIDYDIETISVPPPDHEAPTRRTNQPQTGTYDLKTIKRTTNSAKTRSKSNPVTTEYNVTS